MKITGGLLRWQITAAEMMRCDQNVRDYGFSPLDLLN